MLAAVGVVFVQGVSPKAGPFVDLNRPLVERRHREREAFRRETLPRELQAGEEITDPEPLSGEIRPHTKPDIDRGAFPLELEETDEDAAFVEGREVGIFPALRVEQFLEIVRVARRVVEVVGRFRREVRSASWRSGWPLRQSSAGSG